MKPWGNFDIIGAIHRFRPDLRCKVLFQEMAREGHFRTPVFKRLAE